MFTPQIAAWLVLAIWMFWIVYLKKFADNPAGLFESIIGGLLLTAVSVLTITILTVLIFLAFGAI